VSSRPRRLAGLCALGLWGWLVAAAADGPVPADIARLDQVRQVLARVHATNCQARDAAAAFDYQEIARRALGRHWRDRTEADRGELVALLRGHFLGWYSRLCQRQDLLHFQAPVVDGDRAVLPARAIREGRAVSIVYRLQLSDTARWLVYDVEVAGRSHARTLYAELDRILLNEGYRDVVARLAEEQEAARVTRASR
jgi:phospholipid transport system substrate-binding protein